LRQVLFDRAVRPLLPATILLVQGVPPRLVAVGALAESRFIVVPMDGRM
jgi:hypothetical protein